MSQSGGNDFEARDENWDWDEGAETELRDPDDPLYGLSLEDIVHADLERDLADFEQELTDEEIQLLRRMSHKLEFHLSDDAFETIPWAMDMDNSELASWKTTKARAQFLARFRPVPYDCCIKSCCCYVGPHADRTTCPYCKEARYKADGKTPRKRFNYIPIIPRLVGFYRNAAMVKKMQYRSEYDATTRATRQDEGSVDDVFDGDLYNDLRKTRVRINGVDQAYTHFAFARDIALALSTDGFAPWRRRKKTCWPLLLYNYNLPPEIRFHLEHIISVGVIPGPNKPK
ncbi:hypothetical protein CYLTODRAFT_384771, partial [Cylindrobasidium torrendii FP15055 ss-10]